MSIKYKHLKLVFATALLLCSVVSVGIAPKVSAACAAASLSQCSQAECSGAGGTWAYVGSTMSCTTTAAAAAAPGAQTPSSESTVTQTAKGAETEYAVDPAAAAGGNCKSLSNCDFIQKYLNPAITFFAAFFGVAVAISIVMGGIQYGSSAGDPQQAAAAKKRIMNSLIALLTFLFLYALLNFLVPGGLFD